MKTKDSNTSIIDVALKSGLTATEVLQCLSVDHIADGYVSNTGRGRCIRKNGTFDYSKMSDLVHSGNW